MASSPATAIDALALLHEIQVHQVEVQIQDEELRRSRAELDVILARYIQLYDMAAFGHFTVDAGTAICEVNLAGARLFGASRDALVGRRLEQLVAPKSVGVLRAMLADVRSGTPMRTRTLHLATEASTQALHARASADAVNGRFLVALLDAGAAPGVPGQA
jgi:PAS domain S-box-containing protein